VQLFGKLVRADLAHLRSQHSGAYVSSVLYDAGLIREAGDLGVINYTQHALIVIGAITVMVANDRLLSIVLILAAPIATWIMRRFASVRPRPPAGAMAETSALSTAIMESLDGVRVGEAGEPRGLRGGPGRRGGAAAPAAPDQGRQRPRPRGAGHRTPDDPDHGRGDRPTRVGGRGRAG
jgi:hypothetical protein